MIGAIVKKMQFILLNPGYFKRFIQRLQNDARPVVWLVDIDNTLADTWPTIQQQWAGEQQRYRSIPPLKGMIQQVMNRPADADVIFLTARNYIYHDATIAWLQAQGLDAGKENVILVPKGKDKLPYIRAAVQKKKVVYYDDLSYNHENGEIKIYHDVIAAVQQLPLQYIGLAQINAINQTR
jgi:hypothetical protein